MQTPRDKFLYWVALLLVGYNAFTYGRWFLLELLVRTGTWPSEWLAFDAYGYVASLSLAQEVVFFLAVAFIAVAFYFLLRKARGALYAYTGYFIASLTDWLMLVGNPFLGGELNGYFGMTINLIAISTLFWMNALGVLRPRRRRG